MPANCFRSEFSCGVQLIRGETEYTDPELFVKDLAGFITRSSTSYHNIEQYIFSHNTDRYSIGYKIEQYIVQNKLGVVVRSPRAANPVHDNEKPNNHITVWVWTRDVQAFNDHVAVLSKSQTDQKKAEAEKKKTQQDAAKAQQAADNGYVGIGQPHIFGKAGY